MRWANFLDLCALSVPNGFTASGLPTSLQVVCAAYEEATALRIGLGLAGRHRPALRVPAMALSDRGQRASRPYALIKNKSGQDARAQGYRTFRRSDGLGQEGAHPGRAFGEMAGLASDRASEVGAAASQRSRARGRRPGRLPASRVGAEARPA